MGKTIDDEILDELLKGCERPEDLLGGGGLLRELKKALMQRMLGAELSDHLGYEHGSEAPPVQTNRRNGASRKTVKGEDGAFEIEVPRDRDGSFGPKLIAKGQTRIVQRLGELHVREVTPHRQQQRPEHRPETACDRYRRPSPPDRSRDAPWRSLIR